jgi:methyl-accepting chemotaxis protein
MSISIGIAVWKISDIKNRNERNPSAAVKNQDAEIQEIACNVEPVTNGTNDVATNIMLIIQGASETGAAASQAVSSSSELLVQSTPSTSEVSKF